jgi:hypothetical protein
MKQLRFLKTLVYGVGLSVLFASCNSGSTSSADETAMDSTAKDTSATMPTPAPPVPAEPGAVVIIKHKVANYDKWKEAYDSHDSARLANGLHNFVIGRGMDDPNMVIVILKMDDADKAKAFTVSQDTRDRMKKGGVIGTPEIDFVHVVMNDTTQTDVKARLMVKHKVKDWDAWKTVFDSDKQARTDAGLVDRGLGYSSDDNHMVSIVFAVTDRKKAEEFSKSKALKDKMTAGGVEGPPTFFYYNITQKY